MASAKQAPEEMANVDLYKYPTTPANAASMMRVVIPANEKPYVAAVMKGNNDLVDRLEKDVWIPLSNRKGELPSGKTFDSVTMCREGIELVTSKDILKRLPRLDDEQVMFWVELLRQDIRDIYTIGAGIANLAWTLITNEIRLRTADRKLEEVYLIEKPTTCIVTGDDLLRWAKSSSKHKMLLNNELPIPVPGLRREEMQDMYAKVQTVTMASIPPRDSISKMRVKVGKNDRPFEQAVKNRHNSFLDLFEEEVWLKHPKREIEPLTKRQTILMQCINGVREGLELKASLRVRERIPRLSDEEIEMCVEVLSKDIEELYHYGSTTLNLIWHMLVTEIRMRVSDRRLATIYSDDNKLEWCHRIQEDLNRTEDTALPIKVDKEDLDDMRVKVACITAIPIKVS